MNNEIIKKFAIDKFDKKVIINKPADIADFDGVVFDTKFSAKTCDLIFAFI